MIGACWDDGPDAPTGEVSAQRVTVITSIGNDLPRPPPQAARFGWAPDHDADVANLIGELWQYANVSQFAKNSLTDIEKKGRK
jgi:hypothetical protein